MSSPKITRMFGFLELAISFLRSLQDLVLELEDHPPVSFHVDDHPPALRCFVECAREAPDVRRSIVGPLASRVGVMNDYAEARARCGRRPFEHLEVAVGVAERHQRAAADHLLNADRLSRLVVDEIDLGQANEYGPAC